MADESVHSVERAIALLLCLDATSPRLDVASLSEQTGLSRSTAYRLLGTLEASGMVRKRGTRYELGENVLKLAAGYLSANHITIHAGAVLDELAAEVMTGVILAILDVDTVVTIAVGNAVNGQYTLHPTELGRRIPAASTSVGRMLLAYQEAATGKPAPPNLDQDLRSSEEIREQGYEMTTGLLEAGVRTIAVPVYGDNGRVVAGLGILADAGSTSAKTLRGTHLVRLRAAADRLTELSRTAAQR
jgi:IclR family transcriptional regulator, pca regulon regulatory protein